MKVTLTHKGWLLICPVYLSRDDGKASAIARHWIFCHLLDLMGHLLIAIYKVVEFVNPDLDAFIPILVTGKLENPIIMEVEE